MSTATSKINYDKAGYYILALVAIVLLGFWRSYFSEILAGRSAHGTIFHFHGVMMSIWIAMLIVQPMLIRKKKLAAHRLIGKLSFVVMPLLVLSILLIQHYRGNLYQNGVNFIGVMDGVIFMSTFYLIAIFNRRNVNVHARAMVCTAITMIQPASDRVQFNVLEMHMPIVFFVSWAVIYITLIALMIAERKQKGGRWVFPLFFGMHILLVVVTIGGNKFPGIDPAFGKWFLSLPLTSLPTVELKDLPIPENEIDRYTAEWGEGEYVTYKKGDQLWARMLQNGQQDSTRLLYQGNSEFVVDKYKPFLRVKYYIKAEKAQEFVMYFGEIGNRGRTKRKN